MAGHLNKATIIGNLGKDPEVRTAQSGSQIINFSVATTENWTDKSSGDKKERTNWHNIVIFNEPVGKVAEKYLKKGSKVYLEGAIETRKYQDRDGNDRYTTEIVLRPFNGSLILLGDKDGGNRSSAHPGDDGGRTSSRQPAASTTRMNDIIDDDIPF